MVTNDRSLSSPDQYRDITYVKLKYSCSKENMSASNPLMLSILPVSFLTTDNAGGTLIFPTEN